MSNDSVIYGGFTQAYAFPNQRVSDKEKEKESK